MLLQKLERALATEQRTAAERVTPAQFAEKHGPVLMTPVPAEFAKHAFE